MNPMATRFAYFIFFLMIMMVIQIQELRPIKFTMLKITSVGFPSRYKIINGMNRKYWIFNATSMIRESVLFFISEPKKSRRNKVKKIFPMVTSGMLTNLNHQELKTVAPVTL